MKPRLKPLSEQVLVITGCTSGIGLVTARAAARRGARLLLVARHEQALRALGEELRAQGCDAVEFPADVGDERAMREVAARAIDHFGGFDTWVNNAGVSIFGPADAASLEDQRRVFDTNYWGVVHGSLAALPTLRQRGGALINVGSELSDVAVPMQATYVASKHAVKGFTDALRIELLAEKAPVSVTLIRPAAIDTMFVPHARNTMATEPRLPPPVYAPDTVADAILRAAVRPHRDIWVGAASKLASASARRMPSLLDRLFAWQGVRLQQSNEPARHREGQLHRSASELRERQSYDGHVMETSAYTLAATRPAATGAALLAIGALGAAWWWRRSRRSSLRAVARASTGTARLARRALAYR